jgi:hypothetical protein
MIGVLLLSVHRNSIFSIMTETKKTDASLLRIELQLLEQLFIDKFLQDATGNELLPIRRRILALQKKIDQLATIVKD